MALRARALALLVALPVTLFWLASSARFASAQDGASRDGVVALRIAGPDDPALRDSIRELLARLHLGLVGRADDAGAGAPLVARVDIDLSSSTDAVLVVTDEMGEVRVRRSIPRDASAAIVREEIAHAVQSEVESTRLASRDRAARAASPPAGSPASAPNAPPAIAPIAPPSPAAPPPPPSPPAAGPARERPLASSSRSPLGLEVTTLVGAGPVANDAGPGTRIGLSVAAVSRWPLHPAITLYGLYAVPFDAGPVGSVALSAHTNLVSARLLPSVELFHGRWLSLEIAAGGGVDVFLVTPRVGDSAVIVTTPLGPQSTREDPILSAALTAHFGLASGVALLLSAGLDVDLAARDYVLGEGATNVPVLSPWQERPMILAGLGFGALGDVRFGATSAGSAR